jgi:phenylalanine-4-hydroxylase
MKAAAPDRREAERIARQRGIELNSVQPIPKAERLQQLKQVLDRRDVPHPIDRETARVYYELAEAGVPFGIGSLSGQTVELGEYRNAQDYESLSSNDHLSWACLVADQSASKHDFACREYLLGEEMFEIGGTTIPDYYILNARIFQQTGWQLATVNMIIPAEVFFHCHSRKFFPVTTFMRPLGTDYLPEPDVGHDVAGHVATFTIPQVAQVMNYHGLANDLIHHEKELRLKSATTESEVRRIQEEARELLLYAGRLYWFTVEFGLVMQQGKLKAFGAGILSSPGETRYSVESPVSSRVLIDPANDRDLLRLATTDYLISEYQKTCFVMKEFDSLSSLTPQRILHIVHTAQRLPHHAWTKLVPGDQVLNVGKCLTSPNEKYYRYLAGQPLDECLHRTAERNLALWEKGILVDDAPSREFLEAMPEPPAPANVRGGCGAV